MKEWIDAELKKARYLFVLLYVMPIVFMIMMMKKMIVVAWRAMTPNGERKANTINAQFNAWLLDIVIEAWLGRAGRWTPCGTQVIDCRERDE